MPSFVPIYRYDTFRAMISCDYFLDFLDRPFISCTLCLSQKKYQSLCNLYPLRHNKQNVREQGDEQSHTELD